MGIIVKVWVNTILVVLEMGDFTRLHLVKFVQFPIEDMHGRVLP